MNQPIQCEYELRIPGEKEKRLARGLILGFVFQPDLGTCAVIADEAGCLILKHISEINMSRLVMNTGL